MTTVERTVTPLGRTGLDRFLEEDKPDRFGRIGWLTNGSAVTSEGLVWGPRAAVARGFSVALLFGPEHGPHGAVKEGERIGDSEDDVTGLPVCSLYAGEPAALDDALGRCDTLVIDMVDLGARYSTLLATSTELLDAAAQADVRVVVLDRPNYLGRTREGPRLRTATRSIVGKLDLPIRHGLTLGEILRWYARTTGSDANLEIVGFDGPQPVDPAFPPVYLPPSPNLNIPAAQLLYPGTCLTEGTTLSEGRGTANPFQVVGSPELDPEAVIDTLERHEHPGVHFRAVRFVPLASKHTGRLCAGIYIHVTDMAAVRPVALGVGLLSAVFASQPGVDLIREGPSGKRFLDLLWGSPDLAAYLAAGGDERAGLHIEADPELDASLAGHQLYGR